MGAETKIEWCDHTFNPVVGCTKVSPACDRCYAESWAKRTGQAALWTGERRRTSAANWKQPIKWHHDSARLHCHGLYTGRRSRVFCASLADVFDNQWEPEWRADLWRLIHDTPHLDWLLLTKRPQNIAKMLPEEWGDGWPNVWLGTTVENQEEADRRIPHLLAVPAAKRFLSCEPLLGPVDLTRIDGAALDRDARGITLDALRGGRLSATPWHINWVICGGESGHGARPMHPEWARSLRDQCAAASVPFHFKQWGKWIAEDQWHTDWPPPDEAYEPWLDWTGDPPRFNDDNTSVFRWDKAAGAMLDGREHRAFPP